MPPPYLPRFKLSRLAWVVRLGVLVALVALASLASLATASRAGAEPLTASEVPEPLRPWTRWALAGTTLCPILSGNPNLSRCAWPGRLSLELDERGGRFRQDWHLDAKGWVPLPGDAKRWPLDVKADGQLAPVIAHAGGPALELEAGDHTVLGTFAWDSLPESLQIPPETGLLDLRVRRALVPFPARDKEGVIWLERVVQDESDALALVVHRKATDDIPLLLTTRIELLVSGASRETLLGTALPPGFTPMSLDSPLPVRLDPDGRLRVQLRAGTFVLELTARSDGPVAELTRPEPGGPWPDRETWVFESRPNLRIVTVEGLSSIDPAQTTLPDSWKQWPAYSMQVGDTLRLVERRRGEAEPPPNQLTLQRSLWLDFDGAGYTASDHLTGTLNRGSRLGMEPPAALGRVTVDGKDQLITRLEGAALTGVEVRPGPLDVRAESRLPGGRDLSAVGWSQDFDRVGATLNLPPGWRLIHASGVDDEPGAWLSSWSLWRLFLALVVAISLGRLYGVGWGVLSLALFVLIFPERGTPAWLWLGIPVTEALYRAVSSARAKFWFGALRYAAFLIVLLVALPFAIQHLQEGLHPALARHGITRQTMPMGQDYLDPDALYESDAAEEADGSFGLLARSGARAKVGGTASFGSVSSRYNDETIDPTAIVQTGPGLPSWQWATLPLVWSGPVLSTQRVDLYLTGPRTNLGLAIVRVVLLAALLLRLWPRRRAGPWFGLRGERGERGERGGRGRRARAPKTAAAASLFVLAALAPATARADIPDPALLAELRTRLLRKPDCAPDCAASPRLAVEVEEDRLRLRLEVDAAADAAVPLPDLGGLWSPDTVLLNGKPANGVARIDAKLWMVLPKGHHEVALAGSLPARDALQLALPLKPHRVVVVANGWRVEGVHADGIPDDTLQLTRIPSAERATDTSGLKPSELPSFVRVERTLRLGLQWRVATRVTRLTPAGAAIVLEVPLLAGENVTSAGVRVVSGKALVNLSPQAMDTSWESTLEQRSPILLAAPSSLAWIETWRVDVGLIWHPTFGGTPFVQRTATESLPTWQPWPGEQASIELARPEAVPGQTLTIDSSELAFEPGVRAVDGTLSFVIRSSRGVEHRLLLPPDASLQSLSIDGTVQPLRQDGRNVTLAIDPGSHQVRLAFRESPGLGNVFRAPAVSLGAPSVNAEVRITVPRDRWLLFTGGPRLGPTVLFWTMLMVLTVVAIALGRIRWTPLRWWHWWLLGVGLSQTAGVMAACFVGWLFLLGWRSRAAEHALPRILFNLRQLFIVFATLVALGVLVFALHQGLLRSPSMQVAGNGSSEYLLRWFSDRTGPELPEPWMLSVPLWVYRIVMFAWALWMAWALVGWLRWGWRAVTSGGHWIKRPVPTVPAHAAAATGAAAAPAAGKPTGGDDDA